VSRRAVQSVIEKGIKRLDDGVSLVARLRFQKSPANKGTDLRFAQLDPKASQTLAPSLARSAHIAAAELGTASRSFMGLAPTQARRGQIRRAVVGRSDVRRLRFG
jgi:hypothetical protein